MISSITHFSKIKKKINQSSSHIVSLRGKYDERMEKRKDFFSSYYRKLLHLNGANMLFFLSIVTTMLFPLILGIIFRQLVILYNLHEF